MKYSTEDYCPTCEYSYKKDGEKEELCHFIEDREIPMVDCKLTLWELQEDMI